MLGKEKQGTFFQSRRTVFLTHTENKRKKKKKSPINRLLSDTHGFIYSVFHCMYTSLYKKGPFVEGSDYESSTASGPFVFFSVS